MKDIFRFSSPSFVFFFFFALSLIILIIRNTRPANVNKKKMIYQIDWGLYAAKAAAQLVDI